MFYIVYKITNKINGKFYIGCHKTEILDDGYMGSGTLLKRAFKKYGLENFNKEILHVYDTPEEMFTKEKELVCIGEGTYNIKNGGLGGFEHINKLGTNHPIHSKEHMKKMNMAYKEKLQANSDFRIEVGNKISKAVEGCYVNNLGSWIKAGNHGMRGKSLSDEHKKKISQHNKINSVGEHNSQYGTCWIYNSTQNKKIPKDDLDKWLNLGYIKGMNKSFCKNMAS